MGNQNEPQAVAIKNHPLICPVCSNDKFWMRSALLNTAVASFFNFDWMDANATCFVCSECTHVSWFLGGNKK